MCVYTYWFVLSISPTVFFSFRFMAGGTMVKFNLLHFPFDRDDEVPIPDGELVAPCMARIISLSPLSLSPSLPLSLSLSLSLS